jgi:hypothetical protein
MPIRPTVSQSPTGRPAPALRRWSDALAAAGLFGHALHVLPDVPADLFRRAELALLSGDHATAIRLLKELDSEREADRPAEPAVALMLAVARTLAGEPEGWAEVRIAATGVPGSAWASWLVALAGAAVADLPAAGEAAAEAIRGGSRDPRLASIAAAASVLAEDELSWAVAHAAALTLEPARKAALTGEDPLGATLDLLVRAGRPDRAAALTLQAAEDRELSPVAREAWRRAGTPFGVRSRRRFRRDPAKVERRARRQDPRLLTCRCWGSAGWIGAERDDYVHHHLETVDTEPVAGLPARLLTCRLTRLRFLDFPAEGITLPVDAAG